VKGLRTTEEGCAEARIASPPKTAGGRSAVFFHNGLGDYVINRPALRALAKTLPAPVDLLVGAGPQRFLVEDLGFRRVFSTTVSPPAGGRGRDFAFAEDALEPCGWFVNQAPWAGPAVRRLAEQLQAPLRIGVGAPAADPHDPRNAVEIAFAAARHLDPTLEAAAFAAPPRFPWDVEDRVARVVADLGARGWSELLVVHADTAEEKMWSAEGMSRLLCAVLDARPKAFALIVGGRPGFALCNCHRARVREVFGASLATAMCLVARADLSLCVDSCMMHVADSCGRPGVVLFTGATRPERWGPFGSSLAVVRTEGRAADAIIAEALAVLDKAPGRGVAENRLDRNATPDSVMS